MLRILAIGFILVATSVAWFILGATISSRTDDSNSRIKPGVASIWGSPQQQVPPRATFDFPPNTLAPTEKKRDACRLGARLEISAT